MISDQELAFLPCIGGFHLQMTWAKVSQNPCEIFLSLVMVKQLRTLYNHSSKR